MIDPYKQNKRRGYGFTRNTSQAKPPTASQKAVAKSRAFLRKTTFQMYKGQGLSDEEAARRVGVKIPFGRRFNVIDIMKKINEGS